MRSTIPWTLRRSVAPTLHAVELDELIVQVRGQGVVDADTAEGNDLQEKGQAAEDCVESELCRALMEQTWVLQLDRFPCWEIKLSRPPLASVTSVQYVDENGATQTLSASIYTVDTTSEPGRLYLAYQQVWPTTRCQPQAVTITYKAGVTLPENVPVRARLAIKLLVADLYENRETGRADMMAIWRETPHYQRLVTDLRCAWEPFYI